MADIVNITRMYQFADGIPLVNSQLEQEIQNIVDKTNRNISNITDNVTIQANRTIGYIGSTEVQFGSSGNLTFIQSITLTQGQWTISGLAGMYMTDNMVSRWGATITTSSTVGAVPVYPTNVSAPWVSSQLDIAPRTYSASAPYDYIVFPSYTFGVDGVSGSYPVLTATTIYLKAYAVYTGTAPYGFGFVRAERKSV